MGGKDVLHFGLSGDQQCVCSRASPESRDAKPNVTLMGEIIYIGKSLRGSWGQELRELVCLTFLGMNYIPGATACLIKPQMQHDIKRQFVISPLTAAVLALQSLGSKNMVRLGGPATIDSRLEPVWSYRWCTKLKALRPDKPQIVAHCRAGSECVKPSVARGVIAIGYHIAADLRCEVSGNVRAHFTCCDYNAMPPTAQAAGKWGPFSQLRQFLQA
jgi:hypothetical protein